MSPDSFTAEECCKGPDDGPKAVSRPVEPVISGLGGLRVAGIVGMHSPVGGSVAPPVEGRRGVISGGKAAEVGIFGDNARVDETMKVVVMAAATKFIEPIVNFL